MAATKVAVIGDHFVKPRVFVEAWQQLPGADLDIRTPELDWPDTPMVHGYAADLPEELRGAGLETVAVEPAPPDWPLLELDNVTLTPHIAGSSVKATTYRAKMIAEEVRRYLAHEAPVNPC